MRDIWQVVRTPLLTIGVIVVTIAVGMRQLAGNDRRWAIVSNGVVLVSAYDTSRFLQDSVVMVTLGAHEGVRYPIRVVGYYAGSGVPMSVGEIRAALVAAIGARRDAAYEVRPGNSALAGPTPGVTIAYDFWRGGGVRGDLILSCIGLPEGDASFRAVMHRVSSSRSLYTRGRDFEEAVERDLQGAAEARCPEHQPRYVRRQDGGVALVDPMITPNASSLTVTAPVAASSPRQLAKHSTDGSARSSGDTVRTAVPSPVDAGALRRDSLMQAAIARARQAANEITQLRVSPDTVRLSVGEEVMPEQALRITALRGDGSVVLDFAPLFVVEDLRIARLGANGLKGLEAGTTRVLVRPFSGGPYSARQGGVSTSLVVKVSP